MQSHVTCHWVMSKALWSQASIYPSRTIMETIAAAEACVFTHGDLRLANIHVTFEERQCHLISLLDWGMCGFYPESWEACRTTNLLSASEEWDWYMYLPACIAPLSFSCLWFINRIWDRRLHDGARLVMFDERATSAP
ncbi:hypothetical protein K461DRAFT_130849 [Myriangium duriaei CBS 260.36]|uniref:Aminoglycoside phosphotransferase domain-containing protein n=1 Tax=Myriangium duriaei CBS 260.36 TaxID=1168546 RepID=A0A9P4MMN2_9PEZI|nr:hypothetical protein K461DRAFT_130849 [Myriangium duriaei CBS 260.36]